MDVVGESSGSKQLNPDANPFRTKSPDERTLFMTFSSGSPVTRQEIYIHFTEAYGNYVESVYVHGNNEFGKIRFSTSYLPDSIMGDEEVVKISICNKSVWLKKFRSPFGNNSQTQPTQ
ncbi:Rho GTPase activation protein (RhoGAP) with PHdomain [Abeliophyllum distichum]|uniref:Rho GTPase activation protein (RhoGAP) with PHdomain n=1 Tax=Abeliophyllum distichum TaxID=126358 RepID=A0ABD1RS54_9LAMI